MPSVSVIVPNYNHERFLGQRMDSILAQTFTDFEVIVLDDASTDGSVAVMEQYRGDPRVKPLVQNAQNTGVPFAQWNRGVQLATGDYVWIAESDDYAAPGLLQTLVGLLDAHPAVGLAYCQSTAVDAQGETLYSLRQWTKDLDKSRWTHDYINEGKDECRRFLAVKTTIPNASAVVFRRSVYLAAGGADETFRLAGDRLLWVKLLLESDVAFSAAHLNYFRVHDKSVRSRSTRTAIALDESIRIYKYLAERVDVTPEAQDAAIGKILDRWIAEIGAQSQPLKRNLEIYSEVRQLDRRIVSRVFRAVAIAAKRRLSRGEDRHRGAQDV